MARCRCSCVEMRRFAARQCRVIMPDSGNMSIVDARPDTNQVIDVDQLICEIKKRPLLYTRAQTEYIQKVARQREWTEVCQALCKNFRQLSARKKREKGKYFIFFCQTFFQIFFFDFLFFCTVIMSFVWFHVQVFSTIVLFWTLTYQSGVN